MSYTMPLSFPLNLDSMKCARCRKDIDSESYLYTKRRPTPFILTDGAEVMRLSRYHKKCLPPVLFHRFAGSLPASQPASAESLSTSTSAARSGEFLPWAEVK